MTVPPPSTTKTTTKTVSLVVGCEEREREGGSEVDGTLFRDEQEDCGEEEVCEVGEEEINAGFIKEYVAVAEDCRVVRREEEGSGAVFAGTLATMILVSTMLPAPPPDKATAPLFLFLTPTNFSSPTASVPSNASVKNSSSPPSSINCPSPQSSCLGEVRCATAPSSRPFPP